MAGERKKLTLGGQEENWQWRDHRIVYSVAGEGAPLLLQHSLSAASWAFEMRLNIEPLAKHYRVYAPDLPGFGRSERKVMDYTGPLYVEFLTDFARYVAEREGQPLAAISSSLGAAYTIGAVTRSPETFGPLILIAPTGLERLEKPPSPAGERAHRILSGRVGDGVFWLLTTRPSMRIFLRRDGYYDKQAVTPEVVEGFHSSARQPNAKYGPISFVSFRLNHNVREEWPNIKGPVLIVWGRESGTTPLANADLFLKLRPDTELKVIDRARLSVNDERADEFNELALEWLGQHLPTTVSK